MKKILLITTGGTIASCPSENGMIPALSSQDLLSYLPDLSDLCSLDTKELFNLDSTNIAPAHWEEMVAEIRRVYKFYDGFILTHGTDTLAYTAATLYFMIEMPEKPIIITGAQRPITDPDGDAVGNLTDSIVTAAGAPGGVYCVFNHKVMSAKSVRKVCTHDFAAFVPVNAPVLATITDRFLPDLPAHSGSAVFHERIDAAVGMLALVPGLNAQTLVQMGESLDGVILESFGAGGVPTLNSDWADAIAQLQNECVPVVLATQVLSGGTHLDTYEVGVAALRAGALEAGMMTPEACFAALSLALTEAPDFAKVKDMFRSLQNK